ncbi:hypothetical protein [Oceanobacter mangrovi]|uniref:hypothetical protein n=1 Tax=Oceanobacter mangrovi TaxID=2862510 RepID=UPI001C8DD2AB|nr:hypothetical protein [Oceanobacter mangrovi]
MQTITVAEFIEEYCPMTNPFDEQAGFHGFLLGMDGSEHHRVMTFMQETPEQVWTLVANNDGSSVLQSGFTTVKAVGYVVTRTEAVGVVEVVDED